MTVKELIKQLIELPDQDTKILIEIMDSYGPKQYDLQFNGEDCTDQFEAKRAYCIIGVG